MRFGRVAPSGSQCCDKFFSDRRSVRLSTGLLHDFTHEATYGGIFPCSKVFGCLWMGRHRRRHTMALKAKPFSRTQELSHIQLVSYQNVSFNGFFLRKL